MYSMVLMASLVSAGDAPTFGRKSQPAGCTGAPVASCQGYVVSSGCTGTVAPTGCTGAAAPEKKGFLGLCKRRKKEEASTGCTGTPASCYGTVTYTTSSGCYGSVPAPAPDCCLPVPAPTPAPDCCLPVPAPVYSVPAGCTGTVSYGCQGSAAPAPEKKGFLGLCRRKKAEPAPTGCTGTPVGCYGSAPVGCYGH